MKPGNVIVADDAHGPYPYLTDFGLSKNPGTDSFALTQMGQLIGTLAYTAPEEILATEPRDHLVDVYSLGCVMYEALTGAPPFVRERDIDVLYAHVGDPRPRVTENRSDLPAGIDDVVARAMAISAPERYATCTEFVSAARALLGGPVAGVAMPVEAAPEADAGLDSDVPEHPSEEVDVPPGALRLAVRDGLGRGRVLIVEDEVVIGRQSTLDGALAPDGSISRRHARITRAGDGSFVVDDEHSRNGTFVNGERLEETHVLRTGDLLKVGATVFEATVPEEPEETPCVEVTPPSALPEAPDAPERVAEFAVEAGEPGSRLTLRLEFDPEAGELAIAIDGGASVRFVRGSDGWNPLPS